ncbi:hypothetical protein MMC18_004366 [Xylographa bjoerkii]|nr:hypothetical protein [Xylographa bjoerkii]
MADLRAIISSSTYGCYYYTSPRNSFFDGRAKCRLPLVGSEAYTTILSTNSRTKLCQSFTNNTEKAIPECIYAFPLYDGVSVVKFTCNVGGRLLRGIVKEKNAARTTYDEAVANGETAGLFEQLPEASDVFSTKLGNIPAGEVVIVEIEYVGELKQDAETNSIRFTIPTSIAPRYGSVSSTTHISDSASAQNKGLKIVVDAQMPSGSFIQGIQSPSHPIAVNLGTTSTEPQTDPSMTKASATLALGETGLDKDFVLIILAKDSGVPKAILETHPTIPHQRALMVTLVPKFSLPPSRPEIVFVADRSGSMGSNIGMLVSAMKVFLKSMPVGVKFNICSFGSSHSFLFSKSMSYAQDTLTAAISHVEEFAADMGGTETFSAIRATIKRRFKDIPLEIILLTDGDIWQQEELFNYLNEEVKQSRGNIRVFPLGIGRGVSHALIEGIARAGNGFSQAVQDGEKLDNRLVRMLKGALSPHVTDYSLEVKYEVEKEEDEFEMVEVFDKVTEGLKSSLAEVEKEKPNPQAPISLFDTSEASTSEEKPLPHGDRYADLPDLLLPKLIQAPHKIPPLFPFNRTSVYLLMSPDTVQKNPISVILRGTSTHGPLELEIPVEVLSVPAETVHQLAARKVMQEWEEGRGWVFDAIDDEGVLLKERLPSKFSDMVEREAVRLGVQFQIAGKWCSFVAVAANDLACDDREKQAQGEMAHSSKSGAELHVFDCPGRSPSLKRVASNATDRPLKYHAIMGTPLGRVDRRFVTRNLVASSAYPPSPASTVLDRSTLRELAATNETIIKGNHADLCASPDTNGNKSNTEGIPGFRQRISKGSRMIMGSFTGGHRSQQQSPGSGLLFGSSNNIGGGDSIKPKIGINDFTQGPVFEGHILFSGPISTTTKTGTVVPYGSPSPAKATETIFTSSPRRKREAGYSSFRRARGSAAAAAASTDDSDPETGDQRQCDTRGGADGSNAVESGMDGVSTITKGSEASDSTEASRGFSMLDGSPPIIPQALRPAPASRRHLASMFAKPHLEPAKPTPVDWATASDADQVLRIIALQEFEGCWDWDVDLVQLMGLGRAPETIGLKNGTDRKIWTTILVVAWLQGKMAQEEGVWELVVEKATMWLSGAASEEDLVALREEAEKTLQA